MIKWFPDMEDAGPFIAQLKWSPVCLNCESAVDATFSFRDHNGFGSRFLVVNLSCTEERCGVEERLTFSLERAWTVRTIMKEIKEYY